MFDFLLNALVKYLQSHPDQVEKLIDELVNALIQRLSAK